MGRRRLLTKMLKSTVPSVEAKFEVDGATMHVFRSSDGVSLPAQPAIPVGCLFKGKHDHGDLPAPREPASTMVQALTAAKADSDAHLSAAIAHAKAASQADAVEGQSKKQ